MTRLRRRQLLAAGCLTGAAVLAGCSRFRNDTTTADERVTATERVGRAGRDCDPEEQPADVRRPQSGWPSKHGTPGNTRSRQDIEGPDIRSVSRLEESLPFYRPMSVKLPISDPVTADGLVYVSTETSLFVIDIQAGERYYLEPNAPYATAPTVTEEVVFLNPRDQGVWATDREGGTDRWRSLPSETVVRQQPAGDVLAATTNDGSIYGLDLECGEKVWHVDGEFGNRIGVGRSSVYVPRKSELVALDPTDGSVRWTVALPTDIEVGPIVGDDTVCVIDFDLRLHTVDVPSQSIRWSTDDDVSMTVHNPAMTSERIFAVVRGREFDEGPLRAFDVESGEVLWESRIDDEFATAPTRVADAVLALSTEAVYALDPKYGRVRAWARLHRFDYNLKGPPAITEHGIYIRTGFEASRHLRRFSVASDQ